MDKKLSDFGLSALSAERHKWKSGVRTVEASVKLLGLVLLGAFFIIAGANHFVHPAAYVRIVPDYLPAHHALVEISGIFECLGGIGVLVRPTRRLAGIGLVALLVAVFPANLEMAIHPAKYADLAPAWALYARLPLQAVLVAWVWCVSHS